VSTVGVNEMKDSNDFMKEPSVADVLMVVSAERDIPNN
jgi:hypothetical protein